MMVLLSALVAIAVSTATAWLTFHLVKKREFAEWVRAEIERQQAVFRLEREKDKDERVRQEILRWANPILLAVEHLEGRLTNILENHGYPALDPRYEKRDDWSITFDYFFNSTLYVFGVYFSITAALQNALSFELFRSVEEEEKLSASLRKVQGALSAFPPGYQCNGRDVQLFALEQRAIGGLMASADSVTKVISYPDFLEKLGEPRFAKAFAPLRDLLDAVSPEADCRWRRLQATKTALEDLEAVCRDLLRRPADS